MILAMGVSASALGNYVASTNELTPTQEEEAVLDPEPTPEPEAPVLAAKPNPSTGAGSGNPIGALAAAAVLLTSAGVFICKK